MQNAKTVRVRPVQFFGDVVGHDGNPFAVFNFVNADQIQRTTQGGNGAV
jgi:hypothetical protein